jgi:hypothetical protein
LYIPTSNHPLEPGLFFPQSPTSSDSHNSTRTVRQGERAETPYLNANLGESEESGVYESSRTSVTRRHSTSPQNTKRLSAMRARDRACSDGAQTVGLAEFRYQLELERQRRELLPQAHRRELRRESEEFNIHSVTSDPDAVEEGHSSTSQSHSIDSHSFRSVVIPPPPRFPPPLPPSASTVTNTLLHTLPILPSPPSRRTSISLPPYSATPRKSSLPTMPALPNSDGPFSSFSNGSATWKLPSPAQRPLVYPPFDNTTLAYELALAQAQRDVLALERQVYAAEREAFEAERDASVNRQMALEREKNAVDAERARLEKERRDLSLRVKGLEKEITRRGRTIDGLSWLVGAMDGEQGTPVVPDSEFASPSDVEESDTTDEDAERILDVCYGIAQ